MQTSAQCMLSASDASDASLVQAQCKLSASSAQAGCNTSGPQPVCLSARKQWSADAPIPSCTHLEFRLELRQQDAASVLA
eukprot:99864-Chlamydomonas_euryale.AAC.1